MAKSSRPGGMDDLSFKRDGFRKKEPQSSGGDNMGKVRSVASGKIEDMKESRSIPKVPSMGSTNRRGK